MSGTKMKTWNEETVNRLLWPSDLYSLYCLKNKEGREKRGVGPELKVKVHLTFLRRSSLCAWSDCSTVTITNHLYGLSIVLQGCFITDSKASQTYSKHR